MERSLLAGLSLSVTVALAALHGIAPDTPKWAIALPAWFAGVMLWSNANRRTRTQAKVLFGIGIVATLWGTVRGGSVDLGAAIGANALLLPMLAAVSFLRLMTRTEPEARLQPQGWYALWSTLLGVHLFGAVINLSIVFIMGDRLSERGALSPRQVMVLTRAFSACAFWSPFFAGMAAAVTYSPGASLPTLMMWGLPVAVLALAITALGAVREGMRDFAGYPMHFGTLWLPATLAGLVLTLHGAFPDWPVLTIICLLAPGIAVVYVLLTNARPAARLTAHLRSGLPGMSNELLLFLSAGVMAAGIGNLVATFNGWLPLDRYGGPQAALTLVSMWAAAMVGVHPVISIAVLGNLLAPLQPDPNLLAMTFVCAWGTSVGASPFSGLTLSMQGRYGIPAMNFLRWNGGYSLIMVSAASLLLIAYGRP